MNYNTIFMLVFIIMFMMSIIMEFTQFKYINLSNHERIVWRLIMIIPLILSLNPENNITYNLIIIAMFMMTFLSDILLIDKFITGLISFGVLHLLAGIIFIVINKTFNIEVFLITLIINLLIGYGLYKLLYIKDVTLIIMLLSYLTIIILAVTSTITFSITNKSKILLGIGYVLFFLCDYEVAIMNFKNRFVFDQILNNILYYGALGCFALSTWES